tara:strand:- start:1221 stop:1370 length:150 start_codon:yes stop_codon:yes gene_type:complete
VLKLEVDKFNFLPKNWIPKHLVDKNSPPDVCMVFDLDRLDKFKNVEDED